LAETVFAEPAANTWDKVVFHLDGAQTARWALMLARSYLDDVPKARIVFVAYGPGVDFLLEDAKDGHGDPFEYAVWNLKRRGVDFRVCAATLKARGISASDLVDVAEVVPSGVSEIARLQIKEKFAYLKP
jgi:intracellular sulfur oxidation DsrE/DsrF family protein